MPESVSLPLEGRLVNQSKLERQVANVAKKAGRNLKIDLGTNAKDIKSLEQPLGRITGQADEFGKSMQAANARVIAFGASVGLINAVVQSFKSLVTTTIEVEKSLAKINSILKTSTSGLNGLKNEIFEIAKGTEQTFGTVADAALELSRQGLSATEVTKRLNDAMILARLSGISAADAVSGLTAAVNSFTKAGLTTGEVLNKISNAANQFAVSERDLIEGFKRSASVAQQAGVSIDELGGIITAVQQKTARGGAVIGNSFKTIFTRIGRSENLDLLRSIGVQVTDLQGKILPATKLIEGLAKELENLNDVQVRNITEKIGGGFQIAPLIAALSDYSSETSIAIQATEAFRNASNQAYEKNIILNQTLSAAINTTSLSVQDLANRLGELGVTDTFKELLGIFNNFAQKARDVLDGEGIGGDLAKGITSGLGTALIKGGLAIFGLLLYKLSKQLLKFGVDSFKTFLGLNKEAQKLQSIQAQIVQTLIGDKSIREQILKIENSSLSAENKRAQQAEFFNKALRERVALTSQLNKVAVGVSPLIRAGATKRGADGFLPIGAEQKDIGRGVGGASSGAKPVVIPNFAFGNGKKGTMVANSSEYIVPNFAGGGSAIFNQDMVKSMGLPSGAKKINAAGGFIPNFANGKANASKASSVLPGLVNSSKSYILLTGDNSADESKTLYVGPTKKGKGLTAAYSSLDEAQTYLASGFISKVSVPKYSMQTSERKKGSGKSKSDIDYLETKVSDFSSNLARNYAKGLSSDGQIPKATKSKIASLFNKGALSGFAGTIFETGLSAVLNDDEFKDYSSRTDTSRIDLPSSPKLFEKFGVKDASIGSAGAEVKNRAGGDQVKSTAKKFYDILVGKQNAFAYKKDSPLAGKFIDKQSALAKYNISKDEYKKIEADYGVSPSSKRPLPTSLFSRYKLKTSAASGYIPNYAQGGALEEAIQREKEAGVPINQIRVNQDGKLRNSQNPNGIAVTNTRDEPTGAIPNFSRKSTRLGLGPNPVANSGPGTATVDSLNKLGDSAEKSALAQERSNNRMIALTGTAFLLQNVFSGVATETEGFGSKLASAAEGLSSAVFTQGLLGQVGGDLGSLKGSFSEDKSFKSRTAAIKEKAEKSLSALGGKSFKQTSILKFAPVLGKAASIFTKLVPILGTAVTAYQALNPLLKTFGIDILAPIKAIGVAFGIVDSPARKAAKSLEALNDAALQGFGGSAVNAAKRELATIRNPKDKEGKTIKDPVEAIKEALKQASIGTNSTAIEGKEKVRITTGGQSTSVGGFGTFYSRERQQTVTRATFEKDGERIGKQVFDILEETAEETATRMSQELLETLSSKQKAQVLASPTLAIDFVRKQQEVLGKEESKKLTSAQENISVARSKLSDKDLSPEQQKKYNKLLEEALKETERIYDILTKISDESEAQLKIDKERAKLNKELFEQRLTQVQQQKQILTGLKTEREFALEAAKSSFLTSKQRKVELDVELKKSEAIRKKRVDISKALFDSIRSNKTVNTLLAADANELFDEDNGKQYQSILDGIVGTFLKTGKISESQIKQELEKVDIFKKQADLKNSTATAILEEIKSINAVINLETAKKALYESQTALKKENNRLEQQGFDIAQKALQLQSKKDVNELKSKKNRISERQERNSIVFGSGQPSSVLEVLNRSDERKKSAIDDQINRRQKLESVREGFTKTARDEGILGSKGVLEKLSQINKNSTDAQIKAIGDFLNKTAADEGGGFKGALERQNKALQTYINNASKVLGSDTKLFKQSTEEFRDAVREFKGLPKINREADKDIPFEKKFNDLSPDEKKIFLELNLKISDKITDMEEFNSKVEENIDKVIAERAGNVGSSPGKPSSQTKTKGTSSNLDIFGTEEAMTNLLFNDKQNKISELDRFEASLKAAANTRDLELLAAKDQATRVQIERNYQDSIKILEINQQIVKLYEQLDSTQDKNAKSGIEQQIQELQKLQTSILSEDDSLQDMFAKLTLPAEDATRNIKENLVSGAKQFVDTISDGMVDALVSGGSLKDVLRSAALDFTSGMAKAGLNNLLNQIGFGGGGIGGGGVVGVLASVFGKADGGMIQGMVSGGSGMKDDVPAVLMGGEYVMKKSAVQKYGPNFMNSINNGSIPGFAEGGLVNRLETGVVSSDWTPKANRDFLPYDLPPTTNRSDSGVFASRWTAAATKPQGPTPENARNGKGPATAISEYQQFRIQENEKSRTQSGVLASGWTPKADNGYVESGDEEPDREVRTDSGIVASSWTSNSGFERSSKKERVENKSGRVESGLLASRWTPESTQPGFLKTDSFPSILSPDGFRDGQKTASKFKEGFAEAMSSGQVQKFANGGLVSGSPFMEERTADIFGNIRPSKSFKAQSGAGSFYAPGLYNSGSITGSEDLLNFATQGFTSGKNDFIASGNQSSMISLEPESARLTNFGRNRNTPLQDITKGAKEQAFGLDLGYKREVLAYEEQLREIKRQKKAQKKAMLTQLAISVGTMALGAGIAGIKNGVGAAKAAGTSKFLGGVKGFFGGGTLPNQTGTFGGLKNMFSARGTITSGNVGNYIFNNPNSKLTQELLPGVISNAPKAIPVGGGGNVFSNLGNQGSGIMPISSRPNFISGLLNQGTSSNFSSGSSFNFGGIPGDGDGLLPQYRANNSYFDGLGSTARPDERFATGGYVGDRAGIDNVSALLSGGEFVLNRAATERVGPESLQQINSGGDSSLGSEKLGELVEKMEELIDATKQNAGEINISVTGGSGEGGSGSSGGTESTETSGEIEQNQLRQEMAQQIKSKVLEVIREEKRLGGSLR